MQNWNSALQYGVRLPSAFVLLALFLGSSVRLEAAMEPPVPRCASVAVSGDVTLTWTTPLDPLGEFASYQIWSANAAAGPYVLLTNVAVYAQTTQVHVGASANVGPRFYYMTTTTGGPSPEVSLPSDTISTMFLQVNQSVPLGSADLTWNYLAPSATANDTFTVWLEYPIGTWTVLAEVLSATFSYQHVVSVCDDSLAFRVQLNDGAGCTAFSNRDGDVFQDVTPPSSPVITVVTVDTLSGLASITWEPSPQGDTDGYIIVFQAPGGGVIIDTIFGQNNTFYEWDESLADIRAEAYTVAAFDTCEVGTPPSPNTSATRPVHKTMLLGHTYDECAAQVTLSWSEYVGWPVMGLRIFVQIDNGAWTLLANLDGFENAYVHTVAPFRTYCYSVEAFRDNSSVTSLSNTTCVTTDYPGLPAFNYLRSVSVSDASRITIVDSIDVNASVLGYRLERSDNGGPYNVIASRGPSPTSLLVFEDEDVEPASVGYQYRVVVLDACGNRSLISNIGVNIVLKARADLDGFNELEWNGYVDWAGAVQAYGVYRRIADQDFALIHIGQPNPWNYSDNVQPFTATTGRFCYYVVALEIGNPSGINAVSQSNTICAIQEDLVYIPNAIIRGGVNNMFQPVIAYADVAKYELSIINRWGQVFWTTQDPAIAWDGTYGGRPVPMGVYAYYCRYENGAGRIFEKRGTVTVLSALE